MSVDSGILEGTGHYLIETSTFWRALTRCAATQRTCSSCSTSWSLFRVTFVRSMNISVSGSFIDTFTQGIDGVVGEFPHPSCSSLTEQLKELNAFSRAVTWSFAKNWFTSKSYLVKIAMMGILTTR